MSSLIFGLLVNIKGFSESSLCCVVEMQNCRSWEAQVVDGGTKWLDAHNEKKGRKGKKEKMKVKRNPKTEL